MKFVFGLIATLALNACASGSMTTMSSVNGVNYQSAPSDIGDLRLHSPKYFMTDDESPAEQIYRKYGP